MTELGYFLSYHGGIEILPLITCLTKVNCGISTLTSANYDWMHQ